MRAANYSTGHSAFLPHNMLGLQSAVDAVLTDGAQVTFQQREL